MQECIQYLIALAQFTASVAAEADASLDSHMRPLLGALSIGCARVEHTSVRWEIEHAGQVLVRLLALLFFPLRKVVFCLITCCTAAPVGRD